MSKFERPILSPADLRDRFGCTQVATDAQATEPFTGVSTLENATAHDVAFFINPRYLESARASRAGAILCNADAAEKLGAEMAPRAWVAAEPYVVFARVSQHFHRPRHDFEGVSPQASVDATAELGAGVTVFPFAFVGPGAKLGAGCVLYPGVYLGGGAALGAGCILYPNAVVREGCELGARCIVNAGAVIGGDGFGFAPTGMENIKIPQVGGVRMGDDVEVGSNASIDRGAMDDTIIERQTKIDSLVQIAHNVRIGEACFLAGQAGVAGSSVLGKRVTLAGQVGVAGHISIGDFSTVLAKAGVSKSLPAKGVYNGIPARPNREYLKLMAAIARLGGTRGKTTTKDEEGA